MIDVRASRLKHVLFGLSLMCMPLAAYTQPVGDLVLNDLRVSDKEGYLTLEVSFTCTIRYITHFPQESGKELRIKIAPSSLCSKDIDNVGGVSNESVRPNAPANQRVTEIAYEGDLDGGPFLVFYFKNTEYYEVITGPDSRSVTVVIQPPH